MAEDVLVHYLLKQGVRKVDLCVVTHLDEDHCLGLEQLSRRMDVGCFAFPAACEGDERLKGFISERQIFLSRGDMLELGEGAVLSVLSPPGGRPKSPDDNDDCLVIMAEAEGVRALLTGDATAYTEAELSSLYGAELRADILKASHHGSAYSNSEAFVRAADPAFFVISCGRGNSYGHPADRVIDLLRKNSIIYGRTDECGALIIRRSPKGLYAVNAAGDRTWQIR
jgi:competence protein ComEC